MQHDIMLDKKEKSKESWQPGRKIKNQGTRSFLQVEGGVNTQESEEGSWLLSEENMISETKSIKISCLLQGTWELEMYLKSLSESF